MVIMVTKMPMMPSQPSMIESWSLADLRCKVHENEINRNMGLEKDRPTFSTYEGGSRRIMARKRTARPPVSWPKVLIGTASTMAGGLWLLSILGFSVPWFSVLPMGLMIAGSFIIAAALNRGAVSEMTTHDRCDH